MDDWQADSLDVMLGLRADGKWSSFEFAEWVSRQNGKGGIGEARVLVGFIGPLAERLILWSAHEYKTAMEAHRRIGWLLRNLGHRRGDNMIVIPDVVLGTQADIPIKVINTNGEESYERLDTDQRVRFVARTKGSGRGFSGDVNLIDEAFAYMFMHQSALMPTLSARPNPQIVYLSSPPLDAVGGEVMFQLRRRAEAGGDEGLGYRDWGLAGDLSNLAAVDLDDPAGWAAANPALGIRIALETIERERRSMSPVDFARERLGIWPLEPSENGFRVIAEPLWEARKDTAARFDGRPAFGVYVPPDRSNAAIVAAGARAGGGRLIELTGNEHGDDHRPGVRWIVARLKELEAHNPSVIVVDDKALAEECEQAGIVIHRSGVADVVSGCQTFFDGVAGEDLAGRDIWHLGQKDMTDAVAGAATRKIGNSWAWERYGHPEAGPLAAASLALFGHGTPRVHRELPVAFFGAWR